MLNVIVTGGSRGLGLAMARELAANGYCVIAVARRLNGELSSAISEVQARGAGALHFVSADLSKIVEIADLVVSIRKEFGEIYGLVNNAGAGLDGALVNMPISKIQELVHLNTLAPLVLTKFVLRSMLVSGKGRIINVSSIVSFSGHSGLAVYAATKSSLIGFTRSLARETGRLGITVNAVAPGFIETGMTAGMAGDEKTRIARQSALQRLAEPKDIAAVVTFLMAETGRNITGAVLTVDAGNTA
jgi:3-oxoacyl-[acyl-carrier protein] reductase